MENKVEIIERNVDIDALRGLAAILVVIGHAIQLNVSNFDSNRIFNMIYSFHMPLFMFISGMVSFKPWREMDTKLLVKKATVFLVPFFSYTIALYFYRGCFRTSSIIVWICDCIKFPDQSLWYLWILFLNYIILFLTYKLASYFGDIVFGGIIAISIVLYIKGTFIPYGGSFCVWYIPFFFGGYLVSKYKEYIKIWRSKIYFISMLLFVPVSYFWKRIGDSEIKYVVEKMIGGGWMVDRVLCYGVYNYIVAIMGIAFCAAIIQNVITQNSKKVLSYFGKSSLAIYYFNVVVILHIHMSNIFLNIYFGSLIGSIVPIIFAKLIKKIKILNLAIFGTGNK